jgi:hypothetical protein
VWLQNPNALAWHTSAGPRSQGWTGRAHRGDLLPSRPPLPVAFGGSQPGFAARLRRGTCILGERPKHPEQERPLRRGRTHLLNWPHRFCPVLRGASRHRGMVSGNTCCPPGLFSVSIKVKKSSEGRGQTCGRFRAVGRPAGYGAISHRLTGRARDPGPSSSRPVDQAEGHPPAAEEEAEPEQAEAGVPEPPDAVVPAASLVQKSRDVGERGRGSHRRSISPWLGTHEQCTEEAPHPPRAPERWR